MLEERGGLHIWWNGQSRAARPIARGKTDDTPLTAPYDESEVTEVVPRVITSRHKSP